MRFEVFLSLFVSLCGLSLAADKSGVGPNSISLPKGPGSIEGLGESFQPSLNTGTAKYNITLKLPPGTAGHAPALNLSYEGGGPNGPLGFGWSLPTSCIQRRSDHGIPTYGDNLGFSRADTFINDMKEELVPLANGFLFCKNEGAFIRYQQLTNSWVATLPNGTRLDFGLSADARIYDPANTNHIFSWLLQKETDTHGNVIVYSYTNFPGPNNLNQKYLAGIAYGPGPPPWNNFHFVTFVYEDRPDWFEDGRSGFIVRTGKRLQSIVVGTQGPTLAGHLAGDFNHDGIPDNLDRRYNLSYLAYAGTNSFWSLLAKVQPIGADGVSALPASTYGYSVSDPPDTLSAAGLAFGGTNEPPFVMDNPLVDLVDLNGDGLPDILKTEQFGGHHTAYLNLGQLGSGPAALTQWSNSRDVASADGLANNVNLQSSADIAHLADMDGDGVADLVYKSAGGDVYYFPNQNQVAWGTRQLMAVGDSPPPSPFDDPNVRTADLDFDKRIDTVQSIDNGGGSVSYRVWFDLGAQTYSSSVTVPQNSGVLFSQSGVEIADFNGDRVPDIVWLRPASLLVTAGLGYGRFADPVTVAISDEVLDDTQIQHAKLADINGDGLVDLVLERAAPGELWYWLNLGNYTLSRRKIITGLPTAIGLSAVVRWVDLNGNGSTDLVYADSLASPRILTVDLGDLLNNGLNPNSLLAISNGIGAVTLIYYQPSTRFALADSAAGHPWPDPMPFPVTVVAAVTNLDSLGHQYLTTFRYHDGYYDPVEKQFRGFAQADQIEVGDPSAPTLISRSAFDTGRTYEALKGKLLSLSTEQADGSVFWSQTNLWTLPPLTLYTGTNGTNVAYAHPTGTVKILSELGQGTPRRLESDVSYDPFGNETTNADYGIVENGDRSAFNDERITTTEFALNTNAWIIRLPKRQEIRDENGAVLSRLDSFYDDETFSGNNSGLVTVGNLTLAHAWTNASDPAAYITSSRKKYDPYGNAITILDPLAAAPAGTVDVSQGHAREVQYDNRFHTYPIMETVHVGVAPGGPAGPLVSQAIYDEGFGTVNSSIDANTNSTSCSYDTFGRLITIVEPYDTADYPTFEYAYALAVPFGSGSLVNYVETRHRDTTAIHSPKSEMYLVARQFSDGLGRGLMLKTEAEPALPGGVPRVVVSGAVLFNAREKPSVTLNPCFSQAGADLDSLLAFEDVSAPGWSGVFQVHSNLVALSLATAHKTAVAFDATLRGIAATNQDGSFTSTRYEPLLTRNLDENQVDAASGYFGAAMVHYRDGLGRLVRSDEIVHLNDDGTSAASPASWTTLYEYDLNDELTRITDSQNNVKVFQHDGLKRKTLMDDPDRGHMTYTYDDASNLRETVDASGQRIVLAYDGANRLLSETYVGSPLSPRLGQDRGEGPVNVAYHYDLPAGPIDNGDGTMSTAQNTRGRLSFVCDGSGEHHVSYDARGRVQYEIKRIPDPLLRSAINSQLSSPLVSYRTVFEYDPLDRVTRMTYPDNDQVTFEYNARDLLQAIGGGPNGSVLSNITYFPSGQQQQVDFGNGVRSTYVFDPRLRMTNLLTVAPPSTLNRQLISFSYDFDNASNLRQITDQRPAAALPATSPRRNTQTFTYDDLYRLTRVQYNLPNPVAVNGGEINYRYDRIGNLLAQTSDITNTNNGLPLANLGQMDFGGSAGRSNRVGRQPGDPPGPHALSEISNPQSAITNRVYQYDPSGNMTVIDGLTNTWDFKDRLVTCESSQMRADYTYDYTDRRISKTVTPKLASDPVTTNHPSGITTTLYVNNGFEIRDHDAPTKFVFDSATRFARIAGSLSTNVRIQRLRLYAGWNLCSLAVTATNALQQLANGAGVFAGIQAAYQWAPVDSNWLAVAQGEALAAGTVLWIQSVTNLMTSIVGVYSDPSNYSIPSGPSFLSGAGCEAWNIQAGMLAQASIGSGFFDPSAMRWRFWLPSLNSTLGVPEVLAPGQAVFMNAAVPTQVQIPDAALRILYFHHDHLGSANVLTDASGELVEETSFYPFGADRHDHQPRQREEDYKFTQKERDRESGLSYFNTRFLAANLARFTRVDSLAADPPSAWLESPQRLNPYAYVVNNPLKFVDPAGQDRKKAAAHAAPKPKVLIMYGTSQYEDFNKLRGKNRAYFEQALKSTYRQEGGDADYVVVDISKKTKDDFEKMFKGSSYETVVYDGHGSNIKKMILPEGKLGVLKPEDFEEAFKGAKSAPKKLFFYGCSTAKSGFAEDVSRRLPGTEVTGSGNRIAPWYTKGDNPRIDEDRDHNITYKDGKMTKDVRQIDVTTAPLPR